MLAGKIFLKILNSSICILLYWKLWLKALYISAKNTLEEKTEEKKKKCASQPKVSLAFYNNWKFNLFVQIAPF